MRFGDAAGIHQVADKDEDRNRDQREGVERIEHALRRWSRAECPPTRYRRGRDQDGEDHRKAERRTARKRRPEHDAQVPSWSPRRQKMPGPPSTGGSVRRSAKSDVAERRGARSRSTSAQRTARTGCRASRCGCRILRMIEARRHRRCRRPKRRTAKRMTRSSTSARHVREVIDELGEPDLLVGRDQQRRAEEHQDDEPPARCLLKPDDRALKKSRMNDLRRRQQNEREQRQHGDRPSTRSIIRQNRLNAKPPVGLAPERKPLRRLVN